MRHITNNIAKNSKKASERSSMLLEALENRQLRSASPMASVVPGATGGQVLLITDTVSNDVVYVDQQGSTVTVSDNQGTIGQFDASQYSGMRIKTEGEGTEVYCDPSVTISATLKGMGGDDTLVGGSGDNVLKAFYGDNVMNAGQGISRLVSKGDGQDTLISIAGDNDTLVGGSGQDTFWVAGGYSAQTEIDNLNSTETVQQVAGFQSYETVDQYGNYQNVTPGLLADGQQLPEPGYAAAQSASSVMGWMNIGSQPLFAQGGASQFDIQQQALGDCYFLSTMANIAKNDPNLLQQNITALGDGTYAVEFMENGSPTFYRVDGYVPEGQDGNPAFENIAPDGSIWACIYEKAYTEARPSNNTVADYGNIEGGDPTEVFAAFGAQNITEESASQFSDGSQLLQWVENEQSNGMAVEFCTTADASMLTGTPLAENHAYTVEGVVQYQGTEYLEVRNPWGNGGPAANGSGTDGIVYVAVNNLPGTFVSVQAANV